MRLRSFPLALALLIAATPVIGIVCAMDCDQPPATSLPCHDATGPHDGITLRAAHHACDHDHTGASPAVLTTSGARDSIVTSVALPPTFVLSMLPEAHVATAGAVHGPPSLSVRTSSSRITVLRI